MCGIAGILSLKGEKVERRAVERMGHAIRHRGPDEEGCHLATGIGMMIERLKVIDLVTGQQPIYNETRDVALIFNGEIYNYKDLRASLEQKGHTFLTQSDTETIVHLYEEYHDDCVQHLNGMFAIALWDQKRERLLLARDRAGVKPLFYGVFRDRLWFASEIKAILSDPDFPRDLSWDAFQQYLSLYYVTGPATIYKHLHRLPPGHRLVCERGRVRVEKYWDLSFQPEEDRSLEDWKEEFTATWSAAVGRHLQSDVSVGLYLSGGIDSASIVEAASRLSSKVETYSVGYEEASYSELAEARLVASRFQTDHHEYVLRSQQVKDLLPEVLCQLDEPQGDWSSIPYYFLGQQARKNVTVVLIGTGGDELFGGYPTYLAARAARYYRRLPAWLRRRVIEPLVESLPASYERMSLDFMAKSFVRGARFPSEEAHRRFKEIFSDEERARLLGTPRGMALRNEGAAGVFRQYEPHYAEMSWMDRLMYLDFKVFMADCSLYVNDMTTSAHALEGRVPFLDLEMINLAARMPWKWKVRGGTTKYVIREAMEGRLPEKIVWMKKKGFLIPGAVWIKSELKPLIEEVMAQAEKDLDWLFDFACIRHLLQEHFEQKRDHSRRIACLVSFFMWHKAARPVY